MFNHLMIAAIRKGRMHAHLRHLRHLNCIIKSVSPRDWAINGQTSARPGQPWIGSHRNSVPKQPANRTLIIYLSLSLSLALARSLLNFKKRCKLINQSGYRRSWKILNKHTQINAVCQRWRIAALAAVIRYIWVWKWSQGSDCVW